LLQHDRQSSKLSLKNPGKCHFGQKKALAGAGYAGQRLRSCGHHLQTWVRTPQNGYCHNHNHHLSVCSMAGRII